MKTSARNQPLCTSPALLAIAAALALLPACGKQQFQKTTNTVSTNAAGAYSIPAKVDIVVFGDDTGSMNAAASFMQSASQSFLSNLNNEGWDYRFTLVPLTHARAPGAIQITGSRQDLNWKYEAEGWSPPYPGMSEALADMIYSSNFRRPFGSGRAQTFDAWNSTFGGSGGSSELGLRNIGSELSSGGVSTTGMIRPDALLVPIVLGNGDDSETYSSSCDPNHQFTRDCDSPQNGGTWAIMHQHRDQIIQAKGNAARIRFFAAVAQSRVPNSSCYGSDAGLTYRGNRYMEMANELGGRNYDLCNSSISSVLDDIKGVLAADHDNYRQNYLFISEQPLESSIKVTKFLGGDANQAVSIPHDSINGWTYEGYLTNQDVIYYPTSMNPQSGYGIKLHGTAELIGNDRADVKYTTP